MTLACFQEFVKCDLQTNTFVLSRILPPPQISFDSPVMCYTNNVSSTRKTFYCHARSRDIHWCQKFSFFMVKTTNFGKTVLNWYKLIPATGLRNSRISTLFCSAYVRAGVDFTLSADWLSWLWSVIIYAIFAKLILRCREINSVTSRFLCV